MKSKPLVAAPVPLVFTFFPGMSIVFCLSSVGVANPYEEAVIGSTLTPAG